MWSNSIEQYTTLSKPQKLLFKCLIEKVLVKLKSIEDVEDLQYWYNNRGEEIYQQVAKEIAPHSDNKWIWELKLPLKCACFIKEKELNRKKDKISRIEL